MADITSLDLARRAGEQLMGAEADAACGAGYGERSEDRVNHRNGYRDRRWDTRAGTIELAIPRLRAGSYFPEWLLERRRRSEQALVSVVATSTCWASRPGGWRSWPRPWGSRACPRARCPSWPRAWTARWSSSGPGRWMADRTGLSRPMR